MVSAAVHSALVMMRHGLAGRIPRDVLSLSASNQRNCFLLGCLNQNQVDQDLEDTNVIESEQCYCLAGNVMFSISIYIVQITRDCETIIDLCLCVLEAYTFITSLSLVTRDIFVTFIPSKSF